MLCVDSSEAALELLRRSAAMNSVSDRVRRGAGRAVVPWKEVQGVQVVQVGGEWR